MASYNDLMRNNDRYSVTQSNATGMYNSMFSGGGGNPNGVYNKPGSMASSLSSGASQPSNRPSISKPVLNPNPEVSLDPLLQPGINDALNNQQYLPMNERYPGINTGGPITQGPMPGVPSSFLNFYNQPGGFSPFNFGMGMNPGSLGVNYSGQNPNLGRYVPPMMNGTGSQADPNNWMNSGGYAYNSPNSYGSAGVFNYPIWN